MMFSPEGFQLMGSCFCRDSAFICLLRIKIDRNMQKHAAACTNHLFLVVGVTYPVRHKLGCTIRKLTEARNFRFRMYMNCTIYVAKTKALISFAVTAQLIRTCKQQIFSRHGSLFNNAFKMHSKFYISPK